MTEAVKIKRKPGRKSNAEKAAILAAQEQARAGERGVQPVVSTAGNSLAAGRDEVAPVGLPGHETQGVDDEIVIRSTNGGPGSFITLEGGAGAGSDIEPVRPATEGRDNSTPVLRVGALGTHERQGLINEALYVHEMQEATARFDSLNRRWAFRPNSINYVASLTIECKRGPDKREVSISNARFGAENVVEDVMAAIDLLDEAMT